MDTVTKQHAGQVPQPHLEGMPDSILEDIARIVHCSANRHATTNLHALALTSPTIAHAVIPILYQRLEIPNLPALPLLSRTLTSCPTLAKHVKVISLGQTFIDWSQVDIKHLMTNENKTIIPAAYPSAFRSRFFGEHSVRSLVMMWLTHLVELCPNMVGVSLRNAQEVPGYLAHGFANLAAVLRARKGWFEPPARGIFPLAAVRVKAQASGNRHAAAHKTVPMFITAVDYGRKQIDLDNGVEPADFEILNLQSINTLIPGGQKEHGSWWIRNVVIRDASDCGMRDNWEGMSSMTLSACLGMHSDDHVFDLDKQRVLLPPLSWVSTPAPTAATTPAVKGGSKKSRNASNASKSASSSTNASSTAMAAKFAGTINLMCGGLQDAYSVLGRRGFADSQCTHLNLMNPLSAEALGAYASRYPMLINHQIQATLTGLARALANPWAHVTVMNLGSPLFTGPAETRTFDLVARFAQGFPNVTTLTMHICDISMMDALLTVDPFVRRTPDIGRPLKVLKVLRSNAINGIAQWADLPTKYSPPPRTQLCMTRPTFGHLQELALNDRAKWSGHGRQDNIVMIHPGLMHSLKHINIRAARLVVAPPRLAKPNSMSFPSARLLRPNERPLYLAHTTLRNLETLHMCANDEIPNLRTARLTDAMFANVLPTCPNLESLVGDVILHSVQSVLNVVAKFPKVRNLALAYFTADRTALKQLADKLFAHPIRALRPAPHLSRMVLVGMPETVTMSGDYMQHPDVGVFVMGPEVGTVFLSDLRVPGNIKLVPAVAGFTAHDDHVPRDGKRCLCGKGVMGVEYAAMADNEDLVPETWIHPMVGKVVCKACVGWVAEKVVTKHGVVIRKLEQSSGVAEFMEFMSEGVWRLCLL
ncbi:hypothetical protein BCR44DRAFT_34127 [Catenaria anguillulae PL171]|uniref:Uncharacterized protein n=1 Tax=Catenaria anguillulae PL171 TaxID=765915 RepID=A0A1Y2HYU0_9FUNG|nr:hypothetical protein BCR44DRAFT_34127 [Catenaria anguillulae PL171]